MTNEHLNKLAERLAEAYADLIDKIEDWVDDLPPPFSWFIP
jgi:hypothetical protein